MLFLGSVAAEPTAEAPWLDLTVDAENGATWDVKFEIKADEWANYTIKLQEREEWTWSENPITLEIKYAGDSKTFIFGATNVVDLGDGEFGVTWEAYKNNESGSTSLGEMFSDGRIEVAAGEQGDAPGFGMAVALMGVVGVAAVQRRKK